MPTMAQRVGLANLFVLEGALFDGNYCIEQRVVKDHMGDRKMILDYAIAGLGIGASLIKYTNTVVAKPFNDMSGTERMAIIAPLVRFTKPYPGGRGLMCLVGNDNVYGGGNAFLYSTNDPTLETGWSKQNGGYAILTSVQLSDVSNFSCFPHGDVLHALIETPAGLWYSRSVPPELGTVNFGPNLSPAPVILGGGNADPHISPCGRFVVVFHGKRDLHRFGGNYWYVTASVAKLSDDLSLPESWRTVEEAFIIGQTGYHICDPSVFDDDDGGLHILFSYNQATTNRGIAKGMTLAQLLTYLVGVNP